MNPFDIFGTSGDPSSSYAQASGYLKPFYQAGTNILPQYSQTLQNLVQHPTQLPDQIMGQYTESPWAQYQTQTLNKQMANQAAAGGQLGTPNEQIALGKQTQGIVSKDQQQYYNDAMRPFQMGLSGEQYLTGTGMKAGEGMAAQSDMQAALQAKEKAAQASMFGSMVGMGGGIASLALLK